MSGGYTVLFSSLTTGTLCGKWPDVGLWPIVLSLSDRHGVVDVTLLYIATITGLPLDDVRACMQRFCGPDPGSRTPDADGARLALLDPEHREWGWRIVNHGKYRERARLKSKDAARTESGKDAARKRADRAKVAPSDLHQQIIDAYHEILPDLPPVKVWTARRKQLLGARIDENTARGKPADTIGYWRDVFQLVAASDFLCGRTHSAGREPFRCSLEWLLCPNNYPKVIEGQYSNRGGDRG